MGGFLSNLGHGLADTGKLVGGVFDAFSDNAVEQRERGRQQKNMMADQEFAAGLEALKNTAVNLQRAKDSGNAADVDKYSKLYAYEEESMGKLMKGDKNLAQLFEQFGSSLKQHLAKPSSPGQRALPSPGGQPQGGPPGQPPQGGQPQGMAPGGQRALPGPGSRPASPVNPIQYQPGWTSVPPGQLDPQILAAAAGPSDVSQKDQQWEEAKRAVSRGIQGGQIKDKKEAEEILSDKYLQIYGLKAADKPVGVPYKVQGPDGKTHLEQRYTSGRREDVGLAPAEKEPAALRSRVDAEKIIADPNSSEAEKAGARSYIETQKLKDESIKFGPGQLGQLRRAQSIAADSKATPQDVAAAKEYLDGQKAMLEKKIQESRGLLDPDTVKFAAAMYLRTGVMPALGLGGATLRAQILKEAAKQAADQGLTSGDVAANQAYYHADRSAATRLEGQRALTESFATTADANLDLATSLGKEVGRTGSPVLNRVLLHAKGQYAGDDDTLAFESAVTVAANEYAKVITGQTSGAAVSDSARRETQKLLDAAYSQSAFEAVVKLMKQEMENRRKGFSVESDKVRKNLGGSGALKPPASGQPSGKDPSQMSTQELLDQLK